MMLATYKITSNGTPPQYAFYNSDFIIPCQADCKRYHGDTISLQIPKFVTEKQVVKNVILIYHILYDRNPFT